MATQTTKNQKVRQTKAVEFLIGNKSFVSPAKTFVMPDLFVNQAKDMADFLKKNPLPRGNQ
ncbi:hypothetical protein [Dyadobacter sandarakinus]|uniref:Uncharacterized protein n=1 Tax=Dyadobacter sandarakinus TaxID=2747268 RepID=A0ABX7I850_9BACT|nr:hypothetical protein [Dyadobacter sandarakinus]QRR01353.1 hypothetical protein HWI92_10795 [Dyadobacter sandarakinus]